MIRVTEKERETEEQLAKFRRKNDLRWSAIWVIGGLLFLTATILGNIYLTEGENAINWTFSITAVIIFFFGGIFGRYFNRWRITRPDYVPPAPQGWASFMMDIVLWILCIFNGLLDLHIFLEWGAGESQSLMFAIFYFILAFIFALIDFFYILPEATRSVYLHFAVPNDLNRGAIPMSCWRDENFSQITKRLCKNRSFKRLLAKLQFAPNAPMKLMFHEKFLNPESTPTQEGVRSRSVITVIINDEGTPLE